MKPKVVFLAVVLVVLYLIGQKLSWDSQKYDYVNNYMYEYTSPKMRTVLAAGHDALMADLALVRGIQFYGMNYPLFDKQPRMYEQFYSLGQAAVGLDPRHLTAYRFWGFGMTNSEKGKVDSYRFLMAGARQLAATDEIFSIIQPNMWELAKDAAYVAEYELGKATTEWGCEAYDFAMRARDCPEFIHRLKVLACMDVVPDPIPAIEELSARANASSNTAIWSLNLDHVRRLVAVEHKRFWDAAQAAYVEIHGASPTRIEQITKDIPILRKAVAAYHAVSAEWAEDGTPRLFPNLVNPLPEEKGKIEFRVARVPELPEDPYGGEYLILQIDGKPQLVGTGINELERESMLKTINTALDDYRKDNRGVCPEDLEAFSTETGVALPEADGFGYPLLLDYENCRFYFPPVSEENIPPYPPYGVAEETTSQIDLTLIEDETPVEGQGPAEPIPSDSTVEEASPDTGE